MTSSQFIESDRLAVRAVCVALAAVHVFSIDMTAAAVVLMTPIPSHFRGTVAAVAELWKPPAYTDATRIDRTSCGETLAFLREPLRTQPDCNRTRGLGRRDCHADLFSRYIEALEHGEVSEPRLLVEASRYSRPIRARGGSLW